MAQTKTKLDKILDTFFHLPTLITIALIGAVLVWNMYDIDLDLGNGFFRINSSQGSINLYWVNGCCSLDLN